MVFDILLPFLNKYSTTQDYTVLSILDHKVLHLKDWKVQKYQLGEVTVRDCGEIVYVHEDTDCAISDRLAASTLVFSLRSTRPGVTVKHIPQ